MPKSDTVSSGLYLSSRLFGRLYRFSVTIPTGISDKRYGRVHASVEKPWVAPIRRLLAAKDWSQGQLAKKAGVRPNTLSEAMNGRSPRMETLEQVAQAFGVPLYELFLTDEQSLLLKQSAQHQQHLARQEDLAALVIQKLTPVITSAVQEITGQSSTGATDAAAPKESLPAEVAPRGTLQGRKTKTA